MQDRFRHIKLHLVRLLFPPGAKQTQVESGSSAPPPTRPEMRSGHHRSGKMDTFRAERRWWLGRELRELPLQPITFRPRTRPRRRRGRFSVCCRWGRQLTGLRAWRELSARHADCRWRILVAHPLPHGRGSVTEPRASALLRNRARPLCYGTARIRSVTEPRASALLRNRAHPQAATRQYF